MKGLIGYTGFVGGNLKEQTTFAKMYNSKNIADIDGEIFDMLVCAGVYAVKWKANKYPEKDRQGINNLLEHLAQITTRKFVLISTVDVYSEPATVNEDTVIATEDLHAYGENRYYVEQFVRKNFPNALIIRLPGLFGKGLKKNFIHDLMTGKFLDYTHYRSVFQFYYLEHLWSDIQIALDNNLDLLNITSEQIEAGELARKCFNKEFKNTTDKPPVHYDVRSKYADLFAGNCGYLYSKDEIFNDLHDYLQNCRFKED